MRYVSTRGGAPDLSFQDVLLTGLATDGGLYVPTTWPCLTKSEWRSLRGHSYADIAARVISPFVGDSFALDELLAILKKTYAVFDHSAVAPLIQLESSLWLMELFHGPTFAFKDYALQLLGALFEWVLARRGQKITLLGATSGDTGSAAIEACRGRNSIQLLMLYPDGRVSDMQRRQMTCIDDKNIHTLAISGTFDDCQKIVKQLFCDIPLRKSTELGAVNSINWARIMAQIVYYATAALSLGAPDRPVRFAVPTGNFGNVYAGWAAKRMGLPIEQLIIGTNRNDVVTRFFASGTLATRQVEPSLSPSMDIQISSNIERLIFECLNRDGEAVQNIMCDFNKTQNITLSDRAMTLARASFNATAIDDHETEAEIRRTFKTTGVFIDPHSAVAVAAARALNRERDMIPTVALACAHPAKFANTVEMATSSSLPLPKRLADLMTAKEHIKHLPASVEAVRSEIQRIKGMTS